MKRRNKKKSNSGFFFFSGFLFIIIIFIVLSKSEKKLSLEEEYIKSTSKIALKVAKKYDLYPSVLLAQSALESNFGRSKLSKEHNNYFGIKAKDGDKSVNFETWENEKGKNVKISAPFRVYSSKEECFEKYASLIVNAPRYKKVIDASTYSDAAKELQKAGYATDPKYSKKIINLIERYKLDSLDIEARE